MDTMTRYIKYIGAGSKADLNDERAKLTKEKRIAAETENRVRKAELLEVGDVETQIVKEDLTDMTDLMMELLKNRE